LALGDLDALRDIEKLSNSATFPPGQLISAAWQLLKLTNPQLAATYGRLLRTRNLFIRRRACLALVRMKRKSTVSHLMHALDDRDAEVRHTALIGLSATLETDPCHAKDVTFTEDDHGKAVTAWKQWWETGGKKRYGAIREDTR